MRALLPYMLIAIVAGITDLHARPPDLKSRAEQNQLEENLLALTTHDPDVRRWGARLRFLHDAQGVPYLRELDMNKDGLPDYVAVLGLVNHEELQGYPNYNSPEFGLTHPYLLIAFSGASGQLQLQLLQRRMELPRIDYDGKSLPEHARAQVLLKASGHRFTFGQKPRNQWGFAYEIAYQNEGFMLSRAMDIRYNKYGRIRRQTITDYNRKRFIINNSESALLLAIWSHRPLNLDGKIEWREWFPASFTPFRSARWIKQGNKNWDGPDDLSLEVGFLEKERKDFYMAFLIRDDQFLPCLESARQSRPCDTLQFSMRYRYHSKEADTIIQYQLRPMATGRLQILRNHLNKNSKLSRASSQSVALMPARFSKTTLRIQEPRALNSPFAHVGHFGYWSKMKNGWQIEFRLKPFFIRRYGPFDHISGTDFKVEVIDVDKSPTEFASTTTRLTTVSTIDGDHWSRLMSENWLPVCLWGLNCNPIRLSR